LPIYEIMVEGRKFRVEISRKEKEGFEVKINDKKSFEARVDGELRARKLFKIGLGDKSYTIELSDVTRTKPFKVKVNDYQFTVEFRRPTFTPRFTAPMKSASTTVRRPSARMLTVPEGAVIAPMTGKIVSVKAKKGDAVKRGDVVCILEAMKMENEILAPVEGVVQEVNVSEGSAVSEGDILLIIK